MSTFVLGPRKASLTRKAEFGHRVYRGTWVVMGTSTQDGPASAILTPGLPQYGDTWAYGDEVDVWAWCRYDTEVTQLFDEKERGQHWALTFTFSTEPDDKGCAQQQITNPLLQPPKLSGNFTKFREEATIDRFGLPIVNSAFEQIRGPQVEFDDARPTVKIEMNVASLNLPLLYAMRETVNMFPMWGFPPRCIKLSQIGWHRQFYGVCFPYYQWNLEFEINPLTWDKNVADVGTSALFGEWDVTKGSPTLGQYLTKPFPGYTPPAGPPVGPNPNPFDPKHFIRYRDIAKNYTKTPLNGRGVPAGVTQGGGAVAVAQLTNFDSNGNPDGPRPVQNVTIINPGQGYSVAPTVTFSKEFVVVANTATGTASINSAGQVTGITVTNSGLYTTAPTITFQAGTSSRGTIRVEKYLEADFSLLGIPLLLGP